VNDILWFIVADTAAHAAALLAWLPIRYARRLTPVALVACGLLASGSGLLIPLDAKLLRCIVAVIGTLYAIKMYSYYRADSRRRFADYASFLFSWIGYDLLYPPMKLRAQANLSRGREAIRIAAMLAIILLTWITAKQIMLTEEVFQRSWILNHICITVAVVIIMQSMGQLLVGLHRLAGWNPQPIIDNIWLSRTPVEFWRRWSWPMHRWFYRYVFLPAGGRPKAVRAILLVFFVSSILHEILFAVAIGRVTGHQTIFFMLNALGVLASPALERLEAFGLIGEQLMRLITIVFLTATAALMFTSINYIVPIYYRKIWLMW